MASPFSRGSNSDSARPAAIRPGWGVALFVLINAGIGLGLIVLAAVAMVVAERRGANVSGLLNAALDPDTLTPWPVILVEALLLAMVVGATAAMTGIERRPWADYGFAPRGAPARFLQGVLAGGALLAILIGVLWAVGAIALAPARLSAGAAAGFGAQWALAFLMIGAGEEIAVRGYLLHTLARGLGFRWAALISSLVFMALHLGNPAEGPLGLAQVYLIGLVFCFSLWRTGALWWAIGFHTAWDYAQSFVFGVADSGAFSAGALLSARPMGPDWLSGGATGPEGSVLMFAILPLALAIIAMTQKRRDHLLTARL